MRSATHSFRAVFESLLAMGLLAAGCSQIKPPTSEELDRGYVLLLPGVGGTANWMGPMIAGLREAGVDDAIDVDAWGKRPLGTLSNLTSYEDNRKEAARLAGKIVEYRNDHPKAPIRILGYSGGGGMALFTAEALPADMQLDRVVLLAAAISPGYDLAPTIARCRRGVVSFYSENDWGRIGMGTQMFGTMDRQKSRSAGYIGFRTANDALLHRTGFEQIPWIPSWRKLGHGGDHAGYLAKAWARDILAPQLRVSTAAASHPTR